MIRETKNEAAVLECFETMNFVSCDREVGLIEAKEFPGMAYSPDVVCFLSIYEICQGNNWNPALYKFTYEDGPFDRWVFANAEIKTHVAYSSVGEKLLEREITSTPISVSLGLGASHACDYIFTKHFRQ